MGETKVPVMESVRAAVAFAQLNAPQVSGVLAALMLVSLASAAAGRSLTGVLLFVAGVAVGLMANAALLRLAFADGHPGDREFRVGPLGFQWGQPEVRLLGAALLLVFLMLLAVLFWFVVAVLGGTAATVFSGSSTAVAASASRPDSPAMVTAAVLGLVLGLAMVWVGVRVCLYSPATIAEQRIQVFSTWPMTRGRFWPILGAIVLLLLPTIVLTGVDQAWQPAGPAGLVMAILIAAVNAFIEVPLICGLYAHLYKRLRAGQDAPAVTANAAAAGAAPKGPWG